MPIRDVCVHQVVHVGRETTIADAAQLMRRHHVGDLIIAEADGDEPRPVGIITDRDIVLSVVAPGLDPNVITVGDLMGEDLVTAHEDLGVAECIYRMRSRGVRRLPVVNDRGSLVGIVTVDDLIEMLSNELAEISRLIAREQGREAQTRR
jgi:CBS domain-containing protein